MVEGTEDETVEDKGNGCTSEIGKWREDGDSHAKGETYSKDERNT